jgi:Zn finger protein HypA/HybF involved in hydrogenase expression
MRVPSFLTALLLIGLLVAAAVVDGGPPGAASAQAQAETFAIEELEIPFLGEWLRSPHADATSLSFRYWDTADPPLVPVACAKCHAGAGYDHFLGLDGSEPFNVSEPAEPGVITCVNCHNPVSIAQTAVAMPSGAILTGLGREATCMECHQGRSSGVIVAAAIERSGVLDHDQVMEAQPFLNIHYYAAAATLYGSEALGGFQYPGRFYQPRFEHVPGFATCQGCHDPHTLELDLVSCATCHVGVETVADLRDIRMEGSLVDYDGDGDITKGIYFEIANLKDRLLELIQAYAAEVVGEPIGYFDAHPYFFYDQDGDGAISPEEAVRPNAYLSFTPRLLAAAYNYQVVKKDPGAYSHNPKYSIQLLHDSIVDLAAALSVRVDAGVRPGEGAASTALDPSLAALFARSAAPSSELMISDLRELRVVDLDMIARLNRSDAPHFDASSRSWRYWDGAGVVPAACATCHTATGLPFFLAHGVEIAQPPTTAMNCLTCHANEVDFALYEVPEATFPSGVTIDTGGWGENMCAVCHMGRNAGTTVAQRVTGLADDDVAEQLTFINIHYGPAAATRFGSVVHAGYEYQGREYVGFFEHHPNFMTCSQCHDAHNQQVFVGTCSSCHPGVDTVADMRDIREFWEDFDGDGDTDKGIFFEIRNLHVELYEAIQAYAQDVVGEPIGYFAANPYFFYDLDGDGVISPEEATRANAYRSFTPRLLRATYNYQVVKKDQGIYAHNPMYAIQLLFDSLEDLGVDVTGLTRPDATLY